MAVEQIPASFRASDGSKFATEKEAKRHDERITAARDFEQARRTLAKAIAKSQKTADGELFDFGWRDYWFVTQTYKHMPTLFSVQFNGWYDMKFQFDGERCRIADDSQRSDRISYYDIGDLYKHKKNAVAALKQKQAEYIAQCQEELDQQEPAQ
jgi:hypothetical protein